MAGEMCSPMRQRCTQPDADPSASPGSRSSDSPQHGVDGEASRRQPAAPLGGWYHASKFGPKTRYRVWPGANVAVALATLLPDRAFDALTRRQFGYASAAPSQPG